MGASVDKRELLKVIAQTLAEEYGMFIKWHGAKGRYRRHSMFTIWHESAAAIDPKSNQIACLYLHESEVELVLYMVNGHTYKHLMWELGHPDFMNLMAEAFRKHAERWKRKIKGFMRYKRRTLRKAKSP
jgi:hypothetical protein